MLRETVGGRHGQSLALTRSLLSTVVDCADDLLTSETEVRALGVEW
jgi:hypothetical protein